MAYPSQETCTRVPSAHGSVASATPAITLGRRAGGARAGGPDHGVLPRGVSGGSGRRCSARKLHRNRGCGHAQRRRAPVGANSGVGGAGSRRVGKHVAPTPSGRAAGRRSRGGHSCISCRHRGISGPTGRRGARLSAGGAASDAVARFFWPVRVRWSRAAGRSRADLHCRSSVSATSIFFRRWYVAHRRLIVCRRPFDGSGGLSAEADASVNRSVCRTYQPAAPVYGKTMPLPKAFGCAGAARLSRVVLPRPVRETVARPGVRPRAYTWRRVRRRAIALLHWRDSELLGSRFVRSYSGVKTRYEETERREVG